MNQTVTDLFTAANRSERMYDLYIEYFEQWRELGGTVFANFSSVGTYGQFGAWGVLEEEDQDPATAPKYRALLEMIRRYPAVVIGTGTDAVRPAASLYASPNPFGRTVCLRIPGQTGKTDIRIYNGQGILVRTLCSNTGSGQWDGRDDTGQFLPQGTYIYQVGKENGNVVGQVMLLR